MWFPFTLLLLAAGGHSDSVTRFTNIECEILDPTYVIFKQCNLKLLGRGIVGLNLYAILLKGSFNNCLVNLSLWRKFNGYRPFMFNATFDFCKYMAKSNQKISFVKIFLDALLDRSNINHSCPYEHDIIVKDLVFKEKFLSYMPLPSGEYKFKLMAAINKKWVTNVNVHFMRKEDLINS